MQKGQEIPSTPPPFYGAYAVGHVSLSHNKHGTHRLAKPYETNRCRTCSVRVSVRVAVVVRLVRPHAIDKRFDRVAHHGNRFATLVDHGRRRERPFARDLVRAGLGLRSAARDDKHIRHAQLAEIAHGIDIAVAHYLLLRQHTVVVAEGLKRSNNALVLGVNVAKTIGGGAAWRCGAHQEHCVEHHR